MKSLAELAALRQKSLDKLNMRNEDSERQRIVVGMATCGISAGARPVLNTFVEEVANQGLTGKAIVTQTGCIGMCVYEPIVEVYDKDGGHTTYVHVDPEKASKILAEHIGKGIIVDEYTVDAAKKEQGL